MEEKNIKSIKYSFTKKIRRLYLVLVIFLLGTIIFSLIDYSVYNKGTKAAVDYMMTIDYYSALVDENDDYKEKAKVFYDFLTSEPLDELMYDWTINEQFSLGKAMTEMGYPCERIINYFKYLDYSDYIFPPIRFIDYSSYIIPIRIRNGIYGSVNLVSTFFTISLISIVFLFIIHMYYLADKKNSLEIIENTIICKRSGKIKKQFMVRDIKSISFSGIKGLKIEGSGIKYKINLVKNREEIKNTIMLKIEKLSTSTSAVPVQDNVTETLIKYKNLLDNGVITQEEFDAKKKQLLDL